MRMKFRRVWAERKLWNTSINNGDTDKNGKRHGPQTETAKSRAVSVSDVTVHRDTSGCFTPFD